MTNKFIGLIKLSRFKELTFSLLVAIIAAFYSDHKIPIIEFLAIICATYLNVMFAFMINDVEDSEDDKLEKKKAKRNPVSAGLISKKEGYAVCIFIAITSAVFHIIYGNITSYSLNLIALILGFLYSWKVIRLKNKPILDTLSHALFLGGLVFLVPYLAFDNLKLVIIIPIITTLAFAADGSLFNQIRDVKVDSEVGLKNSVSVIGIQKAKRLSKVFSTTAWFGVILIGVSTLDKYNAAFTIPFVSFILLILFYLLYIKRKSTHTASINNILYSLLIITFFTNMYLV